MCLAEVELGKPFQQEVRLPSGLQGLIVFGKFNQSLDSAMFPTGLQKLELAGLFNRSLDIETFPSGLQGLRLGVKLNRNLDNVTLRVAADIDLRQPIQTEFQNWNNVTLLIGFQELGVRRKLPEFRKYHNLSKSITI